MTEIEEKQQLIFQAHPDQKGFHFASDGVAFHLENDALNYANELEDDTVEYLKNPKYKKQIDEASAEETPSPVKDETPVAPKAKAPAKVKAPAKKKVTAKIEVPVVKETAKVAENTDTKGKEPETK